MKITFFHDHVFFFCNGSYYSPGGLPYTTLSDYESFFGCLTVVGRVVNTDLENLSGLSIASGGNVKFSLVERAISTKDFFLAKNRILNVIRSVAKSSDAFIIRLPSRIGFFALDFARRNNIPYLVEVVGCPVESYRLTGRTFGYLASHIYGYKMRLALNYAKYAIYVTPSYLQKSYPTKGKDLFCSDVRIGELETLNPYLCKDFSDQTIVNIGLIGNYSSKYKGIEYALISLSYVLSKFPNARLHILGRGDPSTYNSIVRELGLDKNVNFCGSLPAGDQVISWLKTMDIYIQPSLTEGMPRALIEAMSVGLPCVASCVGGIPDLLDTSCLVPPRNATKLGEVLVNMISDRSLRKKNSDINFEKASYFQTNTLIAKRNAFWHDFRNSLGN